jgi:hypothetical protein
VQLNSRSFDVFVHIRVDCLRVEGNTAYVSGRITHTSDPEQGFIGELNRWARAGSRRAPRPRQQHPRKPGERGS